MRYCQKNYYKKKRKKPFKKYNRKERKVITDHIHLVKAIAHSINKKTPASVEVDDLFADGCIGLMESVRRFKRRYKVKFSNFAARRIQGAMLDGLRKMDWVPRLTRAESKKSGEEPKSMNLKELEIWNDIICDKRKKNKYESKDHFVSMIKTLRPKLRLVLHLVYFKGYLIREAGQIMGILPSRMSQIHDEALGKLKTIGVEKLRG